MHHEYRIAPPPTSPNAQTSGTPIDSTELNAYKACMVSVLLILNAIICVMLIVIILLQRSETGTGGVFGGTGGGGQSVVRNPLARPTAILAGLFLLFSVVTAVINKGGTHGESVMLNAPADASLPAPVLMPESVSATVAPVPAATTVTPTTPTE
ncbi:MAG: preprotein translocase subunit SecG [Alphaproteobacteria bacterium]|nr:MAG: preprotein translocase subunit SecG [Alphaproteobacteria bacterium]